MRLSSALAWKKTKRWLYWTHRWTGIVLCILFAIWFVSGVVMMYVPFPSFRAEERVAVAAPIRWDLVRVRPDAVLAKLGETDFPAEMRLEMTGGQPIYRVTGEEGRSAVSALTGNAIGPVDAPEAMRIAQVMTGTKPQSATLVDHDQWVVTRAYARIAPFWRVRMADKAATDIYVTQKTGEIVQNTDGWERFWNWMGAVPHWIYFEVLRVYQEPWRQTVIWTSGVGIVGSIPGIWIGILRLRMKKRYNSGSVSPYRGWMKWHHIAGLVGGVFLVTWVFSGWMSMSPFGGLGDGDAKAIAQRYTGEPAPHFASTDLSRLSTTAAGARELRFDYVEGRPVILALGADGKPAALDGATAAPLRPSRAQIDARARKAVPGGRLVETTLLTHRDLYWYATGDPRRDARPLPVLRFKFDDPHKSWLYVDPDTGMLLSQSSDSRRTYRWLFSALHSFDLPFLLEYRPLRDGLMIVLSIAGLIISVSGVIVGWRYIRGGKPRRAKPAAKTSPA
jgi:uncharacterized iron-regulated membrane protein